MTETSQITYTAQAWTWSDGSTHFRPEPSRTPDFMARVEAIRGDIRQRLETVLAEETILLDADGLARLAAIGRQCQADYDAAHPFRAGDRVLHVPSGQSLVLATDQAMGAVWFAGYDARCEQVSDCEIIQRATDDERHEMLVECSGGSGPVGNLARFQLEARP